MGRRPGSKNKPKDTSATVIKEAKVKKIDGRKGRVVSPEQLAAMKEGRRLANLKAQEGLVAGQLEETKKEKTEKIHIIGYGKDCGEGERPYPIFSSEKDDYKGKVIYPSAKEAREAKL